MVELTLGQIVKIIVAVLVLVVVAIGVYFGFKFYIIPYFQGAGPSGEQNFTTPFYVELMKPENLVGILGQGSEMDLEVREKGSGGSFDPTEYYFEEDGEIRQHKPLAWDTLVGNVDDNDIIVIVPEYADDPDLQIIDGAIKAGRQIYLP